MKLHVKGDISYVKSRYMCIDVNYFYPNNQVDRSEYIMIQISMVPQEFVDKYNLMKKRTMGTSSHGTFNARICTCRNTFLPTRKIQKTTGFTMSLDKTHL